MIKSIQVIVTLTLLFAVNNFAQYPNIRVDGVGSNDPEEVTIAINPLNPNILAG